MVKTEIRQSHEFFTGSNHAYAEGPQSMEWGKKPLASNAVVVRTTEPSPSFLLALGWVHDGSGVFR